MKKIVLSCTILLTALSLTAFAAQDKGKDKKEQKTECCCKDCHCRNCSCETDCDACKDCRKRDECRYCRDCDHEGYWCDANHHRHDKRHHRHRRGGCCGGGC